MIQCTLVDGPMDHWVIRVPEGCTQFVPRIQGTPGGAGRVLPRTDGRYMRPPHGREFYWRATER